MGTTTLFIKLPWVYMHTPVSRGGGGVGSTRYILISIYGSKHTYIYIYIKCQRWTWCWTSALIGYWFRNEISVSCCIKEPIWHITGTIHMYSNPQGITMWNVSETFQARKSVLSHRLMQGIQEGTVNTWLAPRKVNKPALWLSGYSG